MTGNTQQPNLHGKVNEEFYASVRRGNGGKLPPDLMGRDGHPRRLDNRPADRAYRRRWMELYEAEKRTAAQKHTLSDPVTRCPARKTTPPDTKALQLQAKAFSDAALQKAKTARQQIEEQQRHKAQEQQKQKPDTVKRCAIVTLDAYCEHDKPAEALLNRMVAGIGSLVGGSKPSDNQDKAKNKDLHRYAGGGELGLVPDGKSFEVKKGQEGGAFERSTEQGSKSNTDKITFTAVMHQGCGSHPTWRIIDLNDNKKVATVSGSKATHVFHPPHVNKSDVPNFLNVWWLKNVKPNRYRIETESCSGPGGTLGITVYPNIKSGFKTNFIKKVPPLASWEEALEKARKGINDLFDILRECFPTVKKIECHILEGSLELSNSWTEGRINDALWNASGKVAFDPILDLTVKISVLPLNVPRAIAKYGDVYVYIAITGKWSCAVEFNWNGEEVSGGGLTTGELTVAVGVTAAFGLNPEDDGGYSIVDVDGHAETTVALEGKLEASSEPKIEVTCTGKWKPIALVVSLKLFSGHIRPYEGTWELTPERSYPLGTLHWGSEES